MRTAKLILLAIAILGPVAAIAFYFTSASSNCGGNSAALTDVRQYATLVIAYANDAGPGQFSIATASADQLRSFAHIARDHWLPDAHFLVQRDQSDARVGVPGIVIVCDKPYTNVPKRWFWRNRPTHAVGYADGHTALISTEQYSSLDKSDFVPLDDLVPK